MKLLSAKFWILKKENNYILRFMLQNLESCFCWYSTGKIKRNFIVIFKQ